MKFRNWLLRVMAGRNGVDRFGRFLSAVTVIFLLISLLTGRTGVSSLFWALGVITFFLGLFRSFSRNLPRRRAENEAYCRLEDRVLGRFRGAGERFRQRKDYRFFRCPSCRTWLRVPRGKGKVQVTCRQCGERFARKT